MTVWVVLAIAFGLLSALLWLRSSTLRGRTIKSGEVPDPLPVGDIAFKYTGEAGPEVYHWRIALQNKYNAGAAMLAALALVAQSIDLLT